jgi:hypothetical protein
MADSCTNFPHCLAGPCNPECPMAATNTRTVDEPPAPVQVALRLEEEMDNG